MTRKSVIILGVTLIMFGIFISMIPSTSHGYREVTRVWSADWVHVAPLQQRFIDFGVVVRHPAYIWYKFEIAPGNPSLRIEFVSSSGNVVHRDELTSSGEGVYSPLANVVGCRIVNPHIFSSSYLKYSFIIKEPYTYTTYPMRSFGSLIALIGGVITVLGVFLKKGYKKIVS